MPETDYQKEYEDCKVKIDVEQSACKQLDQLRECMVRIDQIKNTYWQRPCLRDWPCLFTQHRSDIDKLKETWVPLERRLTRECEKQSNIDIIRETVGQQSTASSANHNTNINNHGNGTIVNQPSIKIPKLKV